MSQLDPHGTHGYGGPRRLGGSRPVETKPFFLTSEVIAAALAIAGIAITAATTEAFGAWRAWILVTAVVVAYLLSRGFSKAGTRSHAHDPREHMHFSHPSSGRSASDAMPRREASASEQPTQVSQREEEESRPLFG